jgi:hypothetical protein
MANYAWNFCNLHARYVNVVKANLDTVTALSTACCSGGRMGRQQKYPEIH